MGGRGEEETYQSCDKWKYKCKTKIFRVNNFMNEDTVYNRFTETALCRPNDLTPNVCSSRPWMYAHYYISVGYQVSSKYNEKHDLIIIQTNVTHLLTSSCPRRSATTLSEKFPNRRRGGK